jgi:hypothetical protein
MRTACILEALRDGIAPKSPTDTASTASPSPRSGWGAYGMAGRRKVSRYSSRPLRREQDRPRHAWGRVPYVCKPDADLEPPSRGLPLPGYGLLPPLPDAAGTLPSARSPVAR